MGWGSSNVCVYFRRSELSTIEKIEGIYRSALKTEYKQYDFEQLFDRYFSLRDPAGRQARYKVDNVLTDDGSGAMHALADHFRNNAPTRDAHILASYNKNLKHHEDSCFSWVADCYVGCYAIWDNEEEDDINYEWLRNTLPLMDPFAVDHYVNEVEARHPDRYRKCFTEKNWKRLKQLRTKYDPNGIFHDFLTESEAKDVNV